MAGVGRFDSQTIDEKSNTRKEENFCVLNVLCVFISLVTTLADLTTDILVLAEYCKNGLLYWAIGTFIFIITPNILVNIFSMRWFVIDKRACIKKWLTHGFLVGVFERYIIFLYKVFKCKNLEKLKTQKLLSQRNDMNLLHFIYVFTGTIPQMILQCYAIIVLNENYHTKGFSLSASAASVVWSSSLYIYSVMNYSSHTFKWSSWSVNLTWNLGMLSARISGILLFTTVFGIWMLVPLGLHWFVMTFWILTQKTTFCPNKCEETLYNVVMGLIYCFTFINIREGHTRYRLIMFYTIMITQNFGSLLIHLLLCEKEKQNKPWSIGATIFIITGTIIGISAMILYYKYFHSNGTITWNMPSNDVELNNKAMKIQHSENVKKNKEENYLRSFKSLQKSDKDLEDKSKPDKIKQIPQMELESADKKFLLDHWIARSGTPTFSSAPIGNNSMDVSSIQMHTVENTPQPVNLQHETRNSIGTLGNTNVKKKSFCSPTELTLKLSSLDNVESSLNSNVCNLQKRRGICSSDDLDITTLKLINDEFMKSLKLDHVSEISQDTEGSNKKTSSDSIDMDLDLSFSDINSSDINTFNENIVQKLCFSALKNIKVGNQDADIENIQRIALDILKEMYAKKGKVKANFNSDQLSSKQRDLDTPTENLSVHDYENICAVNIAREAWGLRSWNGYCDIENWHHDGSVVRERKCDTLTSGSSEISSCISQDLKNAILAAPSLPKKMHTYSNVFVKFDRSNLEDYIDTVTCNTNDESYLAKPYNMVDNKDPMQLEPIMEELDDLGDIDPSTKKRLNSESSLVATIDEIRKGTATNSPRNVYNRRDHHRDPSYCDDSVKVETNIKKALWKEPYKFDSSNIMEPLPEKENIMNVAHGSKFDSNKNDLIQNMNQYQNNREKMNNFSDQQLHDFSNKDIDILWQIVSENSLQNSTENLSTDRMTSSMQSLIHKDTSTATLNSAVSKVTNIKKGSKNRPRRKFSILREKFEPSTNVHSDEETLCHRSDVIHPRESNIVNVINHLNYNREKLPSAVNQKHFNHLAHDVKANIPIASTSKSVKEKRSLFMKQVLSPPKFNTKLKYKT